MSDLDDDERPRKCRKIEDNKDDVLRAILHEEIDLEIGLRSRLLETVESRLAWALVLEDVLEKKILNSESHVNRDSTNQFADLAIATFKATNASTELFFPTELVTEWNVAENQIAPVRANDSIRSPLQEPHRPRHATRPHVQLHHEDRVVKGPNRYLYLRDTTSTPIMIYKIACPDCHRSDFPRLQGLLNHCRLKHHREFASHDECVQACASVVPEEEQGFVVEHGLEITGMSASLQRLFKMAVGSYEGIVAASESGEMAGFLRKAEDAEGEETKEPTFATKTLGHHKDTPALAPFLGRTPKKRQINVYDENRTFDILGVDSDVQRRGWKRPHGADKHGEETTEGDARFDDGSEGLLNESVSSKGPLKAYDGSRFHIPLRLIVNDYSLRVPEAEAGRSKESQEATHKWLVAVTTASYSLHISAVLSKMSVVCATDSPPDGPRVPLSISEPPFTVMGTSNEPFLAQITLEWTGTRNRPTQIEHWVQLHDGKSTRPVKGDEQILDVELDRHTEISSLRGDTWRVDWSTKVDESTRTVDENQATVATSENSEPEWSLRLREITRNFPLTAQEFGLRKVPQVPYFLPLTKQHFLSLVEGRRKAVEWGRARAIWEAFSTSGPDGNKTQEARTSDSVVKVAGPIDVYQWMKGEGLCFGSVSHTGPPSQVHKPPQDQFCSNCGYRTSTHRKGKTLRGKDGDDGGLGRVCEPSSFAGRTPIVDAQDFLGNHVQTVKRRCATKFLIGDICTRLLGKVDPSLLIGVRGIVSALRLPSFPIPSVPVSSSLRLTKAYRESELVPHAILSASLRALIRSLVWTGLQSMELKSESLAKTNITGSSGSHVSKRRLLVPAHIIRGLTEGARKKGQRDLHRALLLVVGRLGVGVHDAEPPRDQPDLSGLPMHGSDHDEQLHPEIK